MKEEKSETQNVIKTEIIKLKNIQDKMHKQLQNILQQLASSDFINLNKHGDNNHRDLAQFVISNKIEKKGKISKHKHA